MEYSVEAKIPKERIAVLIGKKGEVKDELERLTDSKIDVDSKEGDVTMSGDDSIKLFSLQGVVKAIGRGFNPELALLLLKPDYVLEVLNLQEFVGKKSHMERVKGRIIGAEGKARSTIEELTGAFICVYGKTISMIGEPDQVVVARKAVESIIHGSPHSNVYRWLEKHRRKVKEKNIIDW